MMWTNKEDINSWFHNKGSYKLKFGLACLKFNLIMSYIYDINKFLNIDNFKEFYILFMTG